MWQHFGTRVTQPWLFIVDSRFYLDCECVMPKLGVEEKFINRADVTLLFQLLYLVGRNSVHDCFCLLPVEVNEDRV